MEGSGKSQKRRRLLALDSFTTGVLTVHFQQVEKEKGDAYQDHGLAFCWEDGRPIYPDTITEEFNRLVDLLGIAEDSVPRHPAHLRDDLAASRGAPEDCQLSLGTRDSGVHARHVLRGQRGS